MGFHSTFEQFSRPIKIVLFKKFNMAISNSNGKFKALIFIIFPFRIVNSPETEEQKKIGET